MYQVSEVFAAAAASPVQVQHIRGTIGELTFTDDDLLAGSLVITNQCADSSNVVFGSVYVGELKCTFLDSLLIARRTWVGLDITIEYGLTVADQTVEYIPVGIYRVTEASHTAAGVTVRAYDRMSFFDGVCDAASASGTPYQLAVLACESCHATLGMTASDFDDLVNGSGEMVCEVGSSLKTWRDFLGYLAAALGCFATVNRSGALVFRPLVPSSSVDTIDRTGRFRGGSFSDYSLAYGAVTVDNIDSGKTDLYVNGLDGLTMELKDNPFLQDKSSWESRRQALADYAADLTTTPFTVTLLGSPAYDLNDVITFTDGIADDTAIYAIHRYEFKYKKGFKLYGYGKNPALAEAKTADEKQLSHVAASTAGKGVVFYPFMNATDLTYHDGGGKATLLTITFYATDLTYVMLEGQAVLTIPSGLEDTAKAKLTYYLDGEEILTIHPEWTWSEEGKHTITFMYPVIVSGEMHRFTIMLEADGSDITIGAGEIRAVIWGQNLAATSMWDGNIELDDEVGIIDIGGTPITLAPITDTSGFNLVTDTPIRIGDEIIEPVGYITIRGGITMAEITDAFVFGKNIKLQTWGSVQASLIWDELNVDYHW